MPNLNLMTWNVYGGDTNLLMQAMTGAAPPPNAGVNLNLDLVILEEAVNQVANQNFYNPINTLTAHHNYGRFGPILENFSSLVLPGTNKRIYAAQGVNRSYVVLYRTGSINSLGGGLLNWTTDPNLQVPQTAFEAAQDGFNQRPPLVVTFNHRDGGIDRAMTLFAWHAPVGHYNTVSMDMLDESARLTNAEAGGGRVIIAGDLNTANLGAYFNNFAGLQDKFDYILSNFGAVTDLRNVVANSGPLLDQLWGDAHPAVAGQIAY